jgi:hypothetical protein
MNLGGATKGQQMDGTTQIVVADRGWVFVGKTTIQGDMVKLENARNIRRWGTTSGLGELADGPKPDTKLDNYGEVNIPLRAVVAFIKCNRDW